MVKQRTYRPGLGNLRSTFTFGWLGIFGLIKCLTSFYQSPWYEIYHTRKSMQCMSGPHKVNFPLITLTYIHVYITSRRPLLMFRLEYIWKPLVGVLSQFDLVFRNTCPWSKPGQKRSGWDEIFLFLLILPAGNFSHSKCAFRPNWAFSGNIETDYL